MKKKNILHIALLSTLTLAPLCAQENNVTTNKNEELSPPQISKITENNTSEVVALPKQENNESLNTNDKKEIINASKVVKEVLENTSIKAVTPQKEENSTIKTPDSSQVTQVTDKEVSTTSIVDNQNNTVANITPVTPTKTNPSKLTPVKKEEKKETPQVPTATEVVNPPIVPTNDVIITMPSTPQVPVVTTKVPKLIILNSSGKTIEKDSIGQHSYTTAYTKEKVVFSKNIAPAKYRTTSGKAETKVNEISAGDIDNGRVTAYLHSALITVDEVKTKLTSAGFKILSTFNVDKKGTATSIVFTNDAIIKGASKTDKITRGFAAALRITVDTKNELVSISNPIYIMKAFMQEEYNQELAQTTLKQLRDTFPDVKNSEEIIKFNILSRFQFMENMPYYQDMKIVSEGTNEELLAKVKKSKQLVFEQTLENGSILVGVHLGKRTRKFVKKIGYKNSGLLPYPVVIEKGKAYMLAPQYYIAVMYPQLKMSQFMKIATIPGAIAKDIDRAFR